MMKISTRVVCKVQKEEALVNPRDTMNVCYYACTLWMLHKGRMHTWKAALLSKAQAWTKSWGSPADIAIAGLVGQQIFVECVLYARAPGWTVCQSWRSMLLSQGRSCGVTSYVHAHLSRRVLSNLSEISLRSIFKGLKVLLYSTGIYGAPCLL